MKKPFLILVILMLVCSVCIKAQNNQPKLNQLELSKKLIGVWQSQRAKDTTEVFEMSLYKNAVLETMYHIVKGVKELNGAITFTYDPKSDNFKGYWVSSEGKPNPFHFKFSSEKEVVFESVEDFNTNKIKARNTGILADPEHLTINHFNSDLVQYGSTKWVRTSSGR